MLQETRETKEKENENGMRKGKKQKQRKNYHKLSEMRLDAVYYNRS